MSTSIFSNFDWPNAPAITGSWCIRGSLTADERADLAKIWPPRCAAPARNKPHGPERKGKGGKVKRW